MKIIERIRRGGSGVYASGFAADSRRTSRGSVVGILKHGDMKIVYNKIIPFKGFAAINLLGVIFARKECRPLSVTTVNHEAIHTAQMRELLYLGFYLSYLIEWLVRLFLKGDAYRNISFEKEAYACQHIPGYALSRRHFAQWR